jgi:hypothetical protein
MGSFFGGLLGGFNRAAAITREESRREQDAQDARENEALKLLTEHGTPELADAAASAMFQKALGGKAPKQGFMAGLMGNPRAITHPAVQTVMALMRQPEQVGGGLPVSRGTMSAPTSPAQPAPSGASAAMAPPPDAAGGGVNPGALTPPPTPQSLPVSSAPPQVNIQSTQRTPGVSRPRQILEDPAVKAQRLATSKWRGELQAKGDILTEYGATPDERRETIMRDIGGAQGSQLGYRPVGRPYVNDAGEMVITLVNGAGQTMEAPSGPWTSGSGGGGGGKQQVTGTVPDGQGGTRQVSGYFDGAKGGYFDTNGIPLVGFIRQSIATGAGMTRDSLARATFGGRAYALLTPEEQQHVLKLEQDYLRTSAFNRGTGAGEAANQTKLNAPIGINEGAQQGVSGTTTLGQLDGVAMFTPEQKVRYEAIKDLRPSLERVRDLVNVVFPDSTGLIGGITAAAVLAGKRASRDPDLARLEALVDQSLSHVAKSISAETGRLTEQDAVRAQTSLANLKAALLSGDTKESALARIDETLDSTDRILKDLPNPAAALRSRGSGSLTTPPPAPAGDAGTRPASGGGAPPAPAGAPSAGGAVDQTLAPDVAAYVETVKVPPGMPFAVIEGAGKVIHKYPDGRVIVIK